VYFETGHETQTQTVITLLSHASGVVTQTQTVTDLVFFASGREIHTITVIFADSLTFVMSIAILWSDVPTYVLVTAETYVSVGLEAPPLPPRADAMNDGKLIGIVTGSAAAIAVIAGAVVFIVRKGTAWAGHSMGRGQGPKLSVVGIEQMDEYSDAAELSEELSTTLFQATQPGTAISTISEFFYTPATGTDNQTDSFADGLWM
jgi:hypothetical protein